MYLVVLKIMVDFTIKYVIKPAIFLKHSNN